MDISSIAFLFYFLPIFLIAYHVSPNKYRAILTIIGSLLFFSWSAGWTVLLLIGSILVDFWLVEGLSRQENKRKRKSFLISSVILNLAPLAYYKYLSTITEIPFGLNIQENNWASTLIPLGLGFVMLQKIAYAVDVYRKEGSPFSSIVDYAFYILFFPKLVAGPFVTLNTFAPQIQNIKNNVEIDGFLSGCIRFSKGLAKKVLIANALAPLVNEVFQNIGSVSTGLLWVGLFAFAIQIFFDFSGYVDMAIGLALMLGFKLPENFHSPYTSTSISSFWRNWHSTFHEWLKNYLYIPLGGNKSNQPKLVLTVMFVVVLAGMWHGFTYTFLLFALYHGMFIVLEKIGFSNVLAKIGKLPAMLYSITVVVIGWAIFKSTSITELGLLFQNLVGSTNNKLQLDLSTKEAFILILSVFLIFRSLIPPLNELGLKLEEKIGLPKYQLIKSVLAIVLLVVSISVLVTGEFVPFIYSKF